MTRLHVRILCFGASITAGWSSGGSTYHPYSNRLAARLKKDLPKVHFDIDVDGFPGDTVLHGQYKHRMERDLGGAKAPYDWVIIQAGGNDLSWNRSPEQIYDAMKAIWNMPLDKGLKMMALTVTEHANSSDKATQKWNTLNSLISNHHQDRFFVADVAKAIPYTSMSDEDRERIWDDGVHLTKEGYQLMGDTIADRLVEIFQSPKPSL